MQTGNSADFTGAERPAGFLITGIGASAGGIQALQEFFRHVPADSDIAYVVILHLSPDHDSKLAEVLQQTAAIPVTQVKNTTKIETNHVYVVPPNKHLTMIDGHISATANLSLEDRRAPVDIFFRSLADTHGPRAVCVVLSGTGANGSMGLKRIKERGGVAYVQSPREAEYSEMPRSSIATDLVDDVLPVAEIPKHIITYRNNINSIEIVVESAQRPEPQQRALRDIFTQLRLRTGNDFSSYKRPTLLRRIERRINIRKLTDLPAYAAFLIDQPDETTALLKNLLISVTNFFRDKKAFEVLERDVLPAIFAGKNSDKQVRIWVAGCATGEEAYSIAMLCCEISGGIPDAPKIQIFATDIDEAAIVTAREGVYTLNDAADVSPDRLRRFFYSEGDGYRVRRELREMILFAHHNFLKDPPFSRLDLVSCRNVMIYLNPTAQERVIETFHFALPAGGFLFLGTSESVDGAGDLFSTYNRDYHIFRSGEIASRTYPVPETGPSYYTHRNDLLQKPAEQDQRLPRLSFGDLHQKLLEQYAPPSVIVNEDYEIVHMTERAGRYLEFSSGEPTQNLLKLIRPELRLELRSAFYRAMQHKIAIDAHKISLTVNGHPESVDICVRPVLNEADPAKGYILVIFKQSESASSGDETVIRASDEPMARQLEEELIRLKSQLRNLIEHHEYQTEELKASNEELQAMNEELRSSAEELETSKEELQSMNEELRTVNQELKVKIDETSIVSSNLHNLINSAEVGTIFLDRSFSIRLFTPAIVDIFNLKSADYGRPITDITNKLQYNDLLKDAETVLEKLKVIETEVQTSEEKFYVMRVFPYRTSDDRINGVVFTFFDITAKKQTEEALRRSEEKYRSQLERDVEERTAELKESRENYASLVENTPDVITRWDKDLKLVFANGAYEKKTGSPTEQALGKTLAEAGVPQEIALPFMSSIQKAFDTGKMTEHYNSFSTPQGIADFYSRMVPEFNADGQVQTVLATGRDISELKKKESAIREEHRRLKEAQSIGIIGSYEWNINDEYVSWSNEMFRICGMDPQEKHITSAMTEDLIYPEDLEAVLALKQRSLATPGEYEIKHRIQLHDGAIKFVNHRFESLGNEEGKVLRVHGTLQDITATTYSEKTLNDQAHFIQSTTEALPDILYVLNLDSYEILYINHSFNKRKGYMDVQPNEENKNMLAVIYEEDVPGMKAHLEQMKNAANGEVREFDYRIRAADGNLHWYRDRNAVFRRNREGVPCEKIGIAQDITERVRAEYELKESNKNLRYANENLRQFASIASHDLQEPLRKLQFFASVLQKFKDDLPEEGNEMISKIDLTSARMSRLIREVLQFSKIAYGERTYESTNLQSVLNNVLTDLDILLNETGTTVSNDHLPLIEASALQMNQLFYNLLTNAVKFRQQGKPAHIEISVKELSKKAVKQNNLLKEDLSYIEIIVKDKGIGFRQEYAEQIFNIFERLHPVEDYEGTGVGLALCKKIVENHSGHIFAVSGNRSGASFHILLPVKQ